MSSDPSDADLRRRLARHGSRLAARWEPGCFVGAVARVIDGAPDGSAAVHHIGAAWPPATDGPPARWPDAVVISSPQAERALLELLQRIPAQARLHLVPAHEVDFGLAVRIALAADRNLQPDQRAALEDFLQRWQDAERVAIAERFTDRDEGFERFVSSIVGAMPGGGPAPGPDG